MSHDPQRILTQPNWRTLDTPLFPWVRTIERIVRAIAPPPMSGPLIFVSSDYGGNGKASSYEVYSILYCDVLASEGWFHKRGAVRSRYLNDGRRMSFKALNDGKRRAALGPFLGAANAISGVAISVAVHKSIKDLCGGSDIFSHCLGNWKQLDPALPSAGFEQMVRVAHLVGLLVGGFSMAGHIAGHVSERSGQRNGPPTRRPA
jgi:hypothetical protein